MWSVASRVVVRIAREEPGVALSVHGVNATGLLKQQKVQKMPHTVQKKTTETVVPKLLTAKAGESSPSPLNKKQQRSAQRLQEFQEKKRATLVQELVSKGTELSVAQGIVARDERKRPEAGSF